MLITMIRDVLNREAMRLNINLGKIKCLRKKLMRSTHNYCLPSWNMFEEIKLKYKNNESRRNEELEKLYRGQAGGGMGCLPVLVQFPIMIALYNGIRLAVSASMTTVLLPWVPSLLARDSTYILPAITVFVQMFPQIMPYVGFFQKLNLQKMNLPMLLILLFSNSWFAVMLPAGIELYYLVSGLFTAAEQISGLWSESERAETA